MKHQKIIHKRIKAAEDSAIQTETFEDSENVINSSAVLQEADDAMVQDAFSTVIAQKKRISRKPFVPDQPKKRRLQSQFVKDEENYIPYVSKDHQTESG